MTLYDRFERVSEADMTKTTRRRLLARAGKVCVGIAAGAAGLSSVGQARGQDGDGRTRGLLSLAYNNDCTNCSGRGYDCGSGCTRWAWYCVDSAPSRLDLRRVLHGRKLQWLLVRADRSSPRAATPCRG